MQSRPLPQQGPSGQDASSGWGAEATAYRPLDWPARMVELLLAVYLVVTLVAVALDWLELNLWTRLLHQPSSLLEAHPTSINGRQALAQVVQSCAYLLTVGGFLAKYSYGHNLRSASLKIRGSGSSSPASSGGCGGSATG